LLFLSGHFYQRGAPDQAIAAGERALALATAGGEVVLHALAKQFLGNAYEAQGDYRRAIDCHRQAMAALDGGRHERFRQTMLPAVLSFVSLTACHAMLGMFAEGRALGEEGLRIAEAVNHPASLMFAYRGMGVLSLLQGDLPRALPLLERAVGICQEADLLSWFPRTAVMLGGAYTLAGRATDAVQLLTQAMEQNLAMESVQFEIHCRFRLGEARLRAGRLEEAQALAERVLALTCTHQKRGIEAYALWLLGEIAAQHAPSERTQAEGHYRQALALAEELGLRPLAAHCYLGLGTLYSQMERLEEARAALCTAIDMYRSMEMTFWLPQAETMLTQTEEKR
jgi:tetratricopeptide (TPR) repeat protein